ncbi:MAG: hypothetical protein RIF33_00845 [Cyclobacteriaceae bacterium]
MMFLHDSQQTQFFKFYKQLKHEAPNRNKLKEQREEYYRKGQEYGFCNDEIQEIINEYLNEN